MNKRIITIFIIFLIVCITWLSISPRIQAENLNAGVVLADDQGNILYDQNSGPDFIPASILKILTSLAAFHTLGETYRFPTQYFFNENSEDLYIKGFGDPLLISEVIEQLCHEIILKTKTNRFIISFLIKPIFLK